VAREKEPSASIAAVTAAWEDMKTGVFQTKKSTDKVKVSKSQLLSKLEALSPKERAIAEKILQGILG
jgi:FixJ family two-component response regulator